MIPKYIPFTLFSPTRRPLGRFFVPLLFRFNLFLLKIHIHDLDDNPFQYNNRKK